jgi:lipopolysaccharide/colanic/teichoic acid biosynthesis glycosyltransferase/glycosyltransferase involved in cell wall biosynthesis
MTPIRVLYLDHVTRLSGAEQSLFDLVVGLAGGPVEPVVVLPEDGPLATQLRAAGVLVRLVPMSKRMLETSRKTLRSPFAAITRLFAFIAAVRRLNAIVKELQPQIIHSNTLKTHLLAIFPAKRAGIPLVWHIRDILPKGWLRKAIGFCARWPSLIVVPSKAVAAGLGRNSNVRKKLRLIPNGVRVDTFGLEGAGDDLRDEISPEGGPVVSLVGRIAPWKGQDVFVQAAAMLAPRYPDARFAIVGAPMFDDEPFWSEVCELVHHYGVGEHVVLTGWRSAQEAMAASDIVVQCSTEPEPFGRTIVEAMASGVPVVATTGGAVQEIMPPKAGFMIPPSRPEILADALDRLLNDDVLRERMGEVGRQAAHRFFDVRRTVSSVATLYGEVVAKAARRAAKKRKRSKKQSDRAPMMPARPLGWQSNRRPPVLDARLEANRPAPRAQQMDMPVQAPPRRQPVAPRPQRPVQQRPAQQPAVQQRPAQRPAARLEQQPVQPPPIRRTARLEPPAQRPMAPAASAEPKPRPQRKGPEKIVAAFRRPAPPRSPRRASVVTGSAAPARAEAPASRPIAVPMSSAATARALNPAPAEVPQTIAPLRPLRLTVEPRPTYDLIKRVLDVFIAGSVLIFGMPLWLLVALWIKLDSNGPVLFKGTVWGKDCKPFRYYKFRSMRTSGSDDAHRAFIEGYVTKNAAHEVNGHKSFKFVGDNRITRVGRFIRKVSVDEIPQLFNVLRGEMSIVGPRPPLEYEYELYNDWPKQRLAVLPGLTGYQQVYARHTASFTEKVEMDLAYIRSRSLKLDIRIIFKTIPNAFKGQ